jgi:hypothetical protein
MLKSLAKYPYRELGVWDQSHLYHVLSQTKMAMISPGDIILWDHSHIDG